MTRRDLLVKLEPTTLAKKLLEWAGNDRDNASGLRDIILGNNPKDDATAKRMSEGLDERACHLEQAADWISEQERIIRALKQGSGR